MSAVEQAEFVAPETEPEMPRMALWRILVEPYAPPTTTAGGIELAQETLDTALLLSSMGQVVDVGPMAFQNKAATPEPSEVGDWILFRSNAGMRVKLRDGREYVILNDDEILGKVGNPSLYQQWV